MALQKKTRFSDDDVRATDASTPTPGKETQVQRLAAQGVSGPAAPLPFADQIADSFGPAHADTVRSIGAHTGGAATAASEDIGAQAYATGNQVAFGGTPDLHTAAHEAAHVVQQRQGVHLKGGVGEAGDPYERHADAVADRVVSGLSAASLLGDASSTGNATAVQRKEAKGAQPVVVDANDADNVLRVMNEILGGNGGRLIGDAPARWRPQMQQLQQIAGGGKLDGRQRRAIYDRLATELAPILAHAATSDYAGDVASRWTALRTAVVADEARARVDNTLVVTDDHGKQEAVEIPDDSNPREQGRVLSITLPKLVESMHKTAELWKDGRTEVLGKELAKSDPRIAKLEHAAQVLALAEGYLKLSDEEFQHELTHIKGVMNGISTYSELVATVLDMSGAAIGLTCTMGTLAMKALGKEALAEAFKSAGEAVGKKLGTVIAVVEVVHGAAKMLDSTASREDRIEGGIEAAEGVGGLVGGPAGELAVMITVQMLKGAQALYNQAAFSWDAGFLQMVFQYMQESAGTILQEGQAVTSAGMLQAAEKDPDRRAALAADEKRRVAVLASTLDAFLERCEPSGPGHGVGNEFIYRYPGNHTILSEAFAGPRQHRGAKSESDVAALAKETIGQIAWCFEHGPAILKGSVMNKHVEDVQGIQDDLDEKAKKAQEKEGE